MIPFSCVITAPSAASLLAKLADLQLLTLDAQGMPTFVNCTAQTIAPSTDAADTRAHAFVALQLADAAAVTAFETAVGVQMLNLPDSPQIGVAGWAPPRPQSYGVDDILWALGRRKDLADWNAALATLQQQIDTTDALASPTQAQTRTAERSAQALAKWARVRAVTGNELWFGRLVAAYRSQTGKTANATATWLAATLAKALTAPED